MEAKVHSPWTLALWLGFALAFDANAQIRTDGTLGGPVTGLTGPNFLINQALGRQVGANLFHSFQVFNVGGGESATFVTTTAGLANVISRVTGGTASQINGPIRLTSTNAAPNFFFINPAGVVFGQGATIDVPAGFHVSTANYIKFPDGNFYADPNVVSTLSSAAPEAFGFLGTSRAAITLKDEALLETRSPKADQPISLIAGEVVIDNARVQTNGGEIRVAAVGSARQEVGLRGPQATAFGDLQVANGALLHSTSSGESNGGNILVSAGNAWIGNDTRGGGTLTGIVTEAMPETSGNAGNVTIAATGDLSLAGLGSIRSETFSTGQGGAIQVTADRIVMIQGGNVRSNAYASGAAGRVEVAARSLIIDGSQTNAVTGISSTNVRGSSGAAGDVDVSAAETMLLQSGGRIFSETNGYGQAGNVTVRARDLTIDSAGTMASTGIFAGANEGTGAAGEIDVTVKGSLSIVDGGAAIASNTYTSGQAGGVVVNAGTLVIDRKGSDEFTGISSNANSGTGNAGRIEVSVPGTLSIFDGGQIQSSTSSSGNAGTVIVKAGTLVIDGASSGGYSTGISSSAEEGTGNAGNIDVTVEGTLSVLNGGSIASDTFTAGNAGNVTVKAGTLVVDGKYLGDNDYTKISSDTFGTGNGGNVDVTVRDTLSIVNGGQISSDANDSGRAGTVTVKARTIVLDGTNSGDVFNGISSDAVDGTGAGGNVNVAVSGTLSIVSTGEISSGTFGAGHAGSVTVTAREIHIEGNSASDYITGISSQAETGSTGNAGTVSVNATETLSIVNAGQISSDTFGSGHAGNVTVKAGTLVIDGINSGNGFNGISSEAVEGTGGAGNVNVAVSGSLSIVNTGQISSDTSSLGHAGSVTVTARDIHIEGNASGFFTGISSDANAGSTGNAGSVSVNATQTLAVVNRGKISSDTSGSGHAGSVTVTARDIHVEGTTSGFTGISSDANSGSTGDAGSVSVNATETLSVVDRGVISSGTYASGRAGLVTVTARDIHIEGSTSGFTGITSQAAPGSSGDAGGVSVNAMETLSVANRGEISSGTFASGRAGSVTVTARDIHIEGSTSGFTGISTNTSSGSTGDAGSVSVNATETLSVVNRAVISSDTSGSGDAGSVTVTARDVRIEGTTSGFTGISSDANPGSTGDAGSVTVNATETLSLINHAEISSSTFASGRAGSVVVKAGDLRIEGGASGFVTGILSRANSGSTGDAGSVDVRTADLLSLASAGVISSSTFGSGNAGGVTVAARNIVIDGQGNKDSAGLFSAAAGGSGNAGSVNVAATETLTIVNHGEVSSSTTTAGRAGTVTVNAGNIAIEGDKSGSFTGIRSVAEAGSSGDAGSVDVSVIGRLSFANPSAGISSGTAAAGRAGSVDVKAGTIVGDNGGIIGAAADPGSSGQTGTVAIEASEGITLTNGASFSIRNDATLANPGAITPTLLTVTAPNMSLANGGQITAASSGNVAASDIQVNFGAQMIVNNASIATSANDGNGGSIAVNGAGSLVLQNGQITTSVAGTQGNGGDIGITTPILVMQTGFIQANTAAKNASGGNVDIHVATLLPSGGTLFVGGSTPYIFTPDVFGFNVIQAAAPTGVSGTIAISTPVLDITGSLSALPAKLLDSGGLARSPCAIVGGSSLSEVGRGGLPRGAGDLLWIDSLLDPSASPNTESTSLWTWGSPHPSAVPDSRSRTAPCAS